MSLIDGERATTKCLHRVSASARHPLHRFVRAIPAVVQKQWFQHVFVAQTVHAVDSLIQHSRHTARFRLLFSHATSKNQVGQLRERDDRIDARVVEIDSRESLIALFTLDHSRVSAEHQRVSAARIRAQGDR